MNLLSQDIVWNSRDGFKTLSTTWIPPEIPMSWKRPSGFETCSRTLYGRVGTSRVFRPVSGLRGTLP
jgi:hypothetical protein